MGDFDANDNDESEITSELDLSSLSSTNPIQFEQDLMSAHETQTQNHKDHLTKLISTSTSNDVKNNDKQLSHRRGQSHILSSPDANNFQEYLSCCDQLFNKYGNRNYIQEDIFMIPESDPYIPVNLDGPGPPPVLITEYPNNNRALPSDIIDNSLTARQKDPAMTISRRIRLPHPNTMHQFSTAVLVPDKAGVVYEDEFLFDHQSSSDNRMSGPQPPPSLMQPGQFLPPGSELPLSAYLRQFQPAPPPPYQLPNNDIGHNSQSSSKPKQSQHAQHQRRKPQNQFNIPLQQENPINLLINTPPRAAEDNKLPFNILHTTSLPLTTTPSPVPKFTNYNTLPPEFDISPFTSTSSLYNPIQANNFQKNRLSDLLDSVTATLSSSSSHPTTPIPTALITNDDPILHSLGPRRRIARPRRPLPGIQHHHQSPTTSLQTTTPKTSTTTTTTTTTRRPYIAPAIDTFNGPSVFSNTDNSLGCSKRGVFAHPESCGMFVVCAPAGRGKKGFRTLTHHCPADQVFVEEVGRCRPGNKDRCEVYH